MIKHYENDELVVTWKPDVCIHSGNCFRKLSSVFDPRRKPWIIMENASSQEIIETIGVCPSGAISYQLKNSQMAEQKETNNSAPIIHVSNAGPLLI